MEESYFKIHLNFSKKGQKIPSDAQASMRAEVATVRQTPQLRGQHTANQRPRPRRHTIAISGGYKSQPSPSGSRGQPPQAFWTTDSGQQISPFDQRTWVVWEGEAMATLISQEPRLSSWARQMQAGRKGARAGAD